MPRVALVHLCVLLIVLPAAQAQEPAPATPALPDKGLDATPPLQQVSGAIVRYTKAPTGEIDGFVLEQGVSVHFPAYLAPRVRALLGDAREVQVQGILVRGTDRDAATVLEARAISNPASGQSLTVSAAAGAPGLEGSAQSPADGR